MYCALVSFDSVPMQAFLRSRASGMGLPSFGHAQLRQPKSGPQFIIGMQLVNLEILGTAVYPLRSCSLSLVAIKVKRRVPAAITQQYYERLYSQLWPNKDMLCCSKIRGSGPRRS